jgi:protein ImuB
MNTGCRTRALYAAIHAAQFPAQALLRLRPDMQSQPIVIVEGRAPQETVCALNSHARRRGVSLGMPRFEVENMNALRVLTRSVECESAAHAVFLECAAQFSPRIEDVSEGTASTVVLDIAGTERLFGPPQRLAERLRSSLIISAGFITSIVVSTNYDAARMKAENTRGITVISEGEEANALAKLPLSALRLEDEHHETFVLWGIRTLGELAALPEVELVTRLGQHARMWRELSLGVAGHTFQPLETKFQLKEFVDFETHVEQMDSLLFVGANMIDSLVARATGRSLSLALLTLQMNLEGEQEYERVIRPAIPSTDRKFLLKLLQLEIAAHPPQAAVVSITLAAEAGQSSKVQLGLFTPQIPEPSRLDVTLARLKALVGDDRVGSPALEDTHQPGVFRIERLLVNGKLSIHKAEFPRMVLRRIRPPVPVRVVLHAMRPAAFRDRANHYEIEAAYGPWKTSGCWWSTNGWDVEEWDVLASNGNDEAIGCLLVLDRMRNRWQLEAFYD